MLNLNAMISTYHCILNDSEWRLFVTLGPRIYFPLGGSEKYGLCFFNDLYILKLNHVKKLSI